MTLDHTKKGQLIYHELWYILSFIYNFTPLIMLRTWTSYSYVFFNPDAHEISSNKLKIYFPFNRF